MFEALVQLHRRFLQLHARRQTVRRLGAQTDETINLFFDVDERLFHVVVSIGWQRRQRKQRQRVAPESPSIKERTEQGLCGDAQRLLPQTEVAIAMAV